MKETRFEKEVYGVSSVWDTSEDALFGWTSEEYKRRARYAVDALAELNPDWGAIAHRILIEVATGAASEDDRAYCHLYTMWAMHHDGFDLRVAGAWLSLDGMANILVHSDDLEGIAERVKEVADEGWPLVRVWVYNDEGKGLPYRYILARPLEK